MPIEADELGTDRLWIADCGASPREEVFTFVQTPESRSLVHAVAGW